MASVIIGDYEYRDGAPVADYASVKAVDKTKSSYGEILSSVVINGVTYPVKDLRACFEGCTSLNRAPSIPSAAFGMSLCFEGCTSLTQAPEIPSGVWNMTRCFRNCTSLTQAPVIPSGVEDMYHCFEGCTSLGGNIYVYPNITVAYDLFSLTQNSIFIINKGSGETFWKGVADQYSNVHYEADDNPLPVVSNFTATRVSAVGSTSFEATGLYAYIQAKLNVYDNLIPVGWTNELKARVLKDNGSTESPTWQPSVISSYPVDVWCWISLGDTSTHTITLQITDSIKDNGTEEASRASNTLSAVVSKSYALVDYYHDPNASGNSEGMSIGKYAEYADLLDVDMSTHFRQQVLAPDYFMELDTSASSGTDKDIYDALVALGWDSDVIV